VPVIRPLEGLDRSRKGDYLDDRMNRLLEADRVKTLAIWRYGDEANEVKTPAVGLAG
jgi:hypothetical protein